MNNPAPRICLIHAVRAAIDPVAAEFGALARGSKTVLHNRLRARCDAGLKSR